MVEAYGVKNEGSERHDTKHDIDDCVRPHTIHASETQKATRR